MCPDLLWDDVLAGEAESNGLIETDSCIRFCQDGKPPPGNRLKVEGEPRGHTYESKRRGGETVGEAVTLALKAIWMPESPASQFG